MNRIFLMAVGIAAMDGLLCAFVAVLALAFLLQSEPESAQRAAPIGMVAVEMTWRSSTPGDARNNVVLGVYAERPSCKQARYWSPNDKFESHGNFETDATSVPETCVIHAQWINGTRLQGQCTAWFVLQSVKPGSRFLATVYVAGTDQYEKPSAERIIVFATTYANASGPSYTLRSQRLTVGDAEGATLVVNIDAQGAVRSDWLAIRPAEKGLD
jgi:hypothetical protein